MRLSQGQSRPGKWWPVAGVLTGGTTNAVRPQFRTKSQAKSSCKYQCAVWQLPWGTSSKKDKLYSFNTNQFTQWVRSCTFKIFHLKKFSFKKVFILKNFFILKSLKKQLKTHSNGPHHFLNFVLPLGCTVMAVRHGSVLVRVGVGNGVGVAVIDNGFLN